eukprot:3108612-Prymnesium_polylepis.1
MRAPPSGGRLPSVVSSENGISKVIAVAPSDVSASRMVVSAPSPSSRSPRFDERSCRHVSERPSTSETHSESVKPPSPPLSVEKTAARCIPSRTGRSGSCAGPEGSWKRSAREPSGRPKRETSSHTLVRPKGSVNSTLSRCGVGGCDRGLPKREVSSHTSL